MSGFPSEYDIESYLSSCISVLRPWSWLYQEKAIDILKTGILDKPPATDALPFLSEISLEEIKNVPTGYIKEEWPSDLKDFIIKCQSLKLNIKREEFSIPEIDPKYLMKMKCKKQEEVAQLSATVMRECSKYSIKHIIDIGSGLGYVDHILGQVYGMNVIGFEKDIIKIQKAKEMAEVYQEEIEKTGRKIAFREAFLSETNLHEVAYEINDWLNGSPACLIALHGCGDLSPLVAKLFAGVAEMKCLILVPCCYHLSKSRPLTEMVKTSGVVNTNLLRMACESTSERWLNASEEELASHARSVLARALVELYPSQGSISVKKKYRHSLRSAARSDWDKCLESCLERFSGVDKEKLTLAWKSNEWRIDQVKAYCCLQVCLQGVAEGLVLADTFLYINSLLDSDVRIRILRIFNVFKSPRSLAFVVNR